MTKAFDLKATPKMKLGIIGFQSDCPCKSGNTYGKCCFRLELAYLAIAGHVTVLLALFVYFAVKTNSPKSFFVAALFVVIAAASAANFARKRLRK